MLKSVYPFANEIVFVTQHDRNFYNETVLPADQTAQCILDFPDPENKIKLGMRRFFSPDASVTQAEMRNWGMYTLGGDCDYWWVVDTDEIYAAADVKRLMDWLKNKRPYGARIPVWHYFKSWNYRVLPFDSKGQIAILRQGQRCRKRRRARPGLHQRLWSWATRFQSAAYPSVPESVCVMHHGEFVGDDNRILKKLNCNGHRAEFNQQWFEEVWQKWKPDARDFNPVIPVNFTEAVRVSFEDLPQAIRESTWPEGWIESDQELGSA